MIYKLKQIDKHLYRGSAPTVEDVIFLYKKLGITKIVSLDEDAGKAISRTCKMLGIKHIMLPIDVMKKSTLLRFMNQDFKKLFSDGDGSVFFHCRRGQDRTGLACALYRCQYQGWSCKEALHEAHQLDFCIDLPKKIKNLFTKLIQGVCKCDEKEDENAVFDSSIVDNERAYPSDYQEYSTGGWAQSSFAPYADYRVREFPYTNVDKYPEQYESRQDYGEDDSVFMDKETKNEMPMVGEYDVNSSGLNGSGPSLVSGFI